MSDPLDGAHLKIVWAQEHLQLIKNEIQRYIKNNPHELSTYKNVQGQWASGPVINVQPDEMLSLMVGDCLTNARAALDYTMFQLVLKWFDPPFNLANIDHRNITSFPLFEHASTNPQSAESNRFAKLKSFMPNVPADAFDTIKSVQPYQRRYESLWWLHELVNTDKHRLLLITKSDIPASNFSLQYPDRTVSIGYTRAVDHLDIMRLGSLSTDAYSSELPKDVKMQYEATIHVTFKDIPMPLAHIKHIPVESVLQQIIETAADVLPRFDKFFV